jgi:hypothetical protein
MAQVTHQKGEDGRYVQIVSAAELTAILIEDGDTLDRPESFGPDDEWVVEEE